MVNGCASAGVLPGAAASLDVTLRLAADAVNGSVAQAATAGATSGTVLPPVPVVDVVAAATGADKPAVPGVPVIPLPLLLPKLP